MTIGLDPSATAELGCSGDGAAAAKPGDMKKPVARDAHGMAYPTSESDAVQKLKRQLDTVPEIRQQRVDGLRQAISDGTYKISPHAVATAMLAYGCDSVAQPRRTGGSGGGQTPNRRDRRRRHNHFTQPEPLTVDSRRAAAAKAARRVAPAALLLPRNAAAQAGRPPSKPA
ncbi:MAG TPA: flagellar biosynthesis anti-sigma factor FlgM [Terracidiphilus sp.]